MKIYKIILSFKGSFLTPLQADTIFGHLCWALYYKEGEDELKKFLEPFREGAPPFLLSDGFPVYTNNSEETPLFPKPLSADRVLKEEHKKIKKLEWVTLYDFNKIREFKEFQPKEIESPLKASLTVHNSISRLTNTSLPEAGVYSLKEYFIQKAFILVKVNDKNFLDKVLEMLKFISNVGYGRKKSIGKGKFSVEAPVQFNEFTEIPEATGFVTLSSFCPAEKDPTEGIYKTFVKYGKLGEEFTFSGSPFKRPLLMIKTGSVFKTDGTPREFYGRMVENISDIKPEVLQYAYAFPIPIIFPQMSVS